MELGDHSERVSLGVTNLGRVPMILGYNWLKNHNPEVNWETGQVAMTRCPSSCHISITPPDPISTIPPPQTSQLAAVQADEDEDFMLEAGDGIFAAYIPCNADAAHLRAAFTPSQRFAQNASPPKAERTFEDLVPEPYRDFKDVFSKDAFDKLPPRKTWDHGIDLVPGAEPQSSRTFPLSPLEQKELDDFLQENLHNG
jgi:hypothetical protein